MVKSISKPTTGKPAKPEKPEGCPLFPHATRRWAKKIRGKLHYFGAWDDLQGAFAKYNAQKDDLHAGRTPRVQADGLTVKDLLNRFLNAKRHLVDTGEITPRTFGDYHAACRQLADVFGLSRLVVDLAADDFDRLRRTLAKKSGPVALGNWVQRVRTVLKYAYDEGLIDRPIRYGATFKRPSRKTLRLERAKKGPRMFEPAELRRIIDAAGVQLRAMILSGVNCGFGNSDVSRLPVKAVDLGRGWIDFGRPKTGIPRRCPLWAETIEALRVALEARPKPKDRAADGLLFVTRWGAPWFRDEIADEGAGADVAVGKAHKVKVDDPVAKEFAKLVRALKLHRPGLGFYALRHTFETVAGDARDQVAVDAIMGHCRDDMASVYRERIDDSRLLAVVDHVHSWLFSR